MSTEDIIDVIAKSITAMATLAGGFGVWFAYRQLKAANNATAITQYANANGWVLELDRTLLAQPSLRPFFRDGVKIDEKHPDYRSAAAMAELTLDTMDFFLRHRFGLQGAVQESWVCWVKDSFDSSPLLVETFKLRRSWYNSVDSALGRLLEEQLEPDWLA
jgi:hypothetical protein